MPCLESAAAAITPDELQTTLRTARSLLVSALNLTQLHYRWWGGLEAYAQGHAC